MSNNAWHLLKNHIFRNYEYNIRCSFLWQIWTLRSWFKIACDSDTFTTNSSLILSAFSTWLKHKTQGINNIKYLNAWYNLSKKNAIQKQNGKLSKSLTSISIPIQLELQVSNIKVTLRGRGRDYNMVIDHVHVHLCRVITSSILLYEKAWNCSSQICLECFVLTCEFQFVNMPC